ncbi:MAG: sugar transferase [Ignavibacteria bacterium]
MLVDNDEAKTREIRMKDFIKNDKKQHEGSSKIINVNNITPIGKILRKTSLDELPQLFNVLKRRYESCGPARVFLMNMRPLMNGTREDIPSFRVAREYGRSPAKFGLIQRFVRT